MSILFPSRHGAHRHRTIQHHKNPYFDRSAPEQSVAVNGMTQWLRRDGWALCGIVLLLAGTLYYWGIASGRYVITNITIQPTQFIPQERIQRDIQTYQEHRWLWLIQRNTYWTLNPEAMEQQLTETLGSEFTIDAIEVTKVYPNNLLVTVNERIPSIQWVTTSESGEEHHYSVDREGIVASTPTDATAVNQLPVLYDRNRTTLGNGWWVISSAYIDFLLRVHEQLPSMINGSAIQHYELPAIDCTERRLVAEKVFESEILESSSEEFKEKKRAVQERFRAGELTVDQSINELERIKQEELQKRGESIDGSDTARLQWAAVTVDVECDIVKVATELNVVATINDVTITIVFDRTVDLQTQLENAQTIIRQQLPIKNISRIDVRIPDRAFVQ